MSNLRKGDLRRSLLDSWSAPANAGRAVAAIASTYEFDAEFYESDLIPRFLGCDRDTFDDDLAFILEREERLSEAYAAVLVDSAHVAPTRMSPRWDQVAIQVPGRRLHAKIVVLGWENVVRLTVGSANLTPNGYRINHEIAFTLDFCDQEDSPPRSIILAFLDMLLRICDWSSPGNPSATRLVKCAREIRNHLLRWRRMSADFRPLAKVKLEPIFVEPARSSTRGRQFFTELAQAVGSRRFDEAHIMSPFFDEPTPDEPSATDVTAERLLKFVRRRGKVSVICRGGTEPDGNPYLEAPERLRETLCARLALDRVLAGPVVSYPGEAEGDRPLHAKALWLYDNRNDVRVLTVGSSNFTKAGTGSGRRANIEANLAIITRGTGAETRAIDHLGEDIIDEYERATEYRWRGSPLEDETDLSDSYAQAPFAVDAMYDVAARKLELTVDAEPAPDLQWAVRLADEDPQSPPIWSSVARKPGERRCDLVLTLVGVPTAIAVSWTSAEGLRRTLVPIAVRDRNALPQPDSIGDLNFEDLVEFLASGQELWTYIQGKRKRRALSRKAKPDLDPHKLVDKTQYLTVRTRLFSQAIASLRERLANGSFPSVDCLVSRLFGPFGPRALAHSIIQQLEKSSGTPPENGTPPLPVDLAVFFLSELCLMLRWLGPPSISIKAQSAEALSMWNRLLEEVDTMLNACRARGSVSSEVAFYARQVLNTAAKAAI